MNNYVLLSKLKEGQIIKILTDSSTDKTKKDILLEWEVTGNSPVLKKLCVAQRYSQNNKFTLNYNNNCFNGFYDFNKNLFNKNEIDKEVLEAELQVALHFSNFERAVSLKKELQKYKKKKWFHIW